MTLHLQEHDPILLSSFCLGWGGGFTSLSFPSIDSEDLDLPLATLQWVEEFILFLE